MANATVNLASIIGDVSGLDTVQSGSLQMIPRAQVKTNDKNFYDVKNIDGLIDAILMDGLQSPLVVNRKGTEYMIISGHRRFAAISQIMDDGHSISEGKLFAAEIANGNIPCLVNEYKSDLQAELALIRANSDTRVLTSAETAQQASRVEELLYLLKEAGQEFPGKMRDYVAEACQVSASKLARLKVITDKLDPIFADLWKKEILCEAPAYALARLSPEHQQKLYGAFKTTDRLKSIQEWRVKEMGDKLTQLDKQKCTDKSPCTNHDGRWGKISSKDYSYAPCADTCCSKCSQLASCKNACAKMAEKIKKIKSDAKAASAQALLSQKEKDAPTIAKVAAIWERFGELRRTANISIKDFYKATDAYYSESIEKDTLDMESGEAKFTVQTRTPYGYNVAYVLAEKLFAAAEMFDCSIEFLLCRTDEPQAGASNNSWRKNNYLPKGRWIATILKMPGDDKTMQKLVYSDHSGNLKFSQCGECLSADLDVIAWFPIPNSDLDEQDV